MASVLANSIHSFDTTVSERMRMMLTIMMMMVVVMLQFQWPHAKRSRGSEMVKFHQQEKKVNIFTSQQWKLAMQQAGMSFLFPASANNGFHWSAS